MHGLPTLRMAPLLTTRVGDSLTAIHCSKLADQWISQGCHGVPLQDHRQKGYSSRSQRPRCSSAKHYAKNQQPPHQSDSSTCWSRSRQARTPHARHGSGKGDGSDHCGDAPVSDKGRPPSSRQSSKSSSTPSSKSSSTPPEAAAAMLPVSDEPVEGEASTPVDVNF